MTWCAQGKRYLHNLFYFPFIILSEVRPSPLGTAVITDLLYQPQMIEVGDCGETGGMKIGRRNRSTRGKPAPAWLCPPQIPHDQTRARTRAAALGSQRLTVWAMARPLRTFIGMLHLMSFMDRTVLIDQEGAGFFRLWWFWPKCLAEFLSDHRVDRVKYISYLLYMKFMKIF
jgi:hypothetical protein